MDAKWDTIGPNDKPLMQFGFDNYGVEYVYRAEWVEGCVTTVSKQNFHYPLGESSEVTAYTLVRDNYVLCELSLSFLVPLFSMGFKNGEDRKKKIKRTNASCLQAITAVPVAGHRLAV